MPSPFPGMDPYLEDPDLWPDVHGTLLPILRDHIATGLPSGYVAKLDQHVWLNTEDGSERKLLGRPDTFVVDAGATGGGTAVATSAATLPTEYVQLAAVRRRRGARFVAIADKRRNRVVTVVELLSPSNKSYVGSDRQQYLDKRTEYLGTGTNLVEIDLLRTGDRVPMGELRGTPADYYVLVSRAEEFPKAGVWGLTVRQPLPIVPVPLKSADGSVPLDLGVCLRRAYEAGHYLTQVDYSAPPVPPLRSDDAAWAAHLLKKHAKKRKR